MKIQLTIACIFVSILSFSQNREYNYYIDWEYQAKMNPIRIDLKNPVDEIEFTIIDKKNRKEKRIKTFDSEGHLLKYYKQEKNNKKTPLIEFSYDSEGKISQNKIYKRGNLKNTVIKKFDKEGKIIEFQKKNAKNKTISRNTWEYNTEGCMTRTSRYKKNGKLDKYWVYEYYDECKKAKTILYNSKDKVINSWNYDCKEEGEKMEKKKKEIPVCRWEETSDNYLIRVEQSFNGLGKAYRRIMKYTPKDTAIVEVATYDANDQLKAKTTYNRSFDKPLEYSYYKKGKIKYQTIRQYQDDRIVFFSHAKNGKIDQKKAYTYNNELITKIEYYKREKLFKTIEVNYGKPFACK